MALYLGLDSSTQSLTAIVIEVTERRREVVFEDSVSFDAALPHYGTRGGVLPLDDLNTKVYARGRHVRRRRRKGIGK